MKSKLPREILSLVNRKSHALGVGHKHAETEKKRLLSDLEGLRAEGKDVNELQKYLERAGIS